LTEENEEKIQLGTTGIRTQVCLLLDKQPPYPLFKIIIIYLLYCTKELQTFRYIELFTITSLHTCNNS